MKLRAHLLNWLISIIKISPLIHQVYSLTLYRQLITHSDTLALNLANKTSPPTLKNTLYSAISIDINIEQSTQW